MMNRRAFLARLGFGTVAAAAAASTFDLERLLWVPGEKTIFLPPVTASDYGSEHLLLPQIFSVFNGTPTFNAVKGSIYISRNDEQVYINVDGRKHWVPVLENPITLEPHPYRVSTPIDIPPGMILVGSTVAPPTLQWDGA
jgi:hypothetical protein